MSNAVFIDGLLNLLESPRFFGFFFENDDQRLKFLEHNLHHALRTSDRYVWVYNEAPDWWGVRGKGVQSPAGLSEVLRRGTENVNNDKPLAISVDSFLPRVRERFNAKVMVSGRVTSNGQPVAEFSVNAGFRKSGPDVSCTSNADGYFDCYVPQFWSGKITLGKEGYSFNPSTIEIERIEESKYDIPVEATRT
jgi:hypothetical protein